MAFELDAVVVVVAVAVVVVTGEVSCAVDGGDGNVAG